MNSSFRRTFTIERPAPGGYIDGIYTFGLPGTPAHGIIPAVPAIPPDPTIPGDMGTPGTPEIPASPWIPTPSTTFTIKASFQPASGETLQTLPQNRKIDEVFIMFSDEQLIAGGTPGIQPDIVINGGKRYEVFKSEPWGNGILPHFKTTVGIEVLE